MVNFYKETENGTILNIKVIPNSSLTAVVGVESFEDGVLGTESYLKIKLSAPANDNKANNELIKFLSKNLKVPKTKLKILKGEKSKEKKVLVPLDVNELNKILN